MALYTNDEISTAVERVVASSIRRPYGRLGNREVGTTFDDLQNATAGVLVLEPNSPHYIIFLGTRRLVETLAAEHGTLVELIEAIENSNRHVVPIKHITPLNNAKQALSNLKGAGASRSRGFTAMKDVPAFKRYDASVQKFLDTSSQNIRRGATMLPTPQESKKKIAGLVSRLKEQHLAVRARVQYLVDALADYDALNLPASMAASVISSAHKVLSDRVAELEPLSPHERLSRIRDVTLDLMAGRAAVKRMGSLSTTTLFAVLEGTGVVFADALHPAVPASLTALPGPYPVVVGADTLDIVVDSLYSFSVLLPGSYVAFAHARQTEPYDITAGLDDQVIIEMPGFPNVVATLTPGFIQKVDDVVADIQAAITVQPLLVDAVFSALRFVGSVNLSLNGPDTDFTLTTGLWSALGALVNELILVTDITSSAVGQMFKVLSIVGSVITASGVQPSGPEVLKDIQLGSRRVPRIRLDPSYAVTSLNARTGFSFPTETTATGLSTIGFGGGSKFRSRSTGADQVAADIPKAFATQFGDVGRLDASVVFAGTPVFDGLGRTDPNNPAKLVAYRLYTRATVSTLGLVATFAVSDAADVQIGDTVVIRETTVLLDQGVLGVVTSVSSTAVVATMVTALTPGPNVLIEVGPTLVLPSRYLDLRVSGSANDDGDYSMDVDGQGSVPFEFTLERTVPDHRDLGGRPIFFNILLGNKGVVVQSTSTLLDSKVEVLVTSTAGLTLFPSLPLSAVGLTPYFQLPSLPNTVTVGDSLEVHETSPLSPTYSYEVLGIDVAFRTLLLNGLFPADYGTLNISTESPVPFGRIRLGKKNQYNVLKRDLEAWLLQSTQPSDPQLWFRELYRLINPLVVSNNPTASQVGTCRTFVQGLQGTLTLKGATSLSQPTAKALEGILLNYRVKPVPSVDVMIHTYLARGSDRGIDTLLQGRFSEFFQLTHESMSRGGHMRETIRSVLRHDMSISKVGRHSGRAKQMTEGTWEDQDFTQVAESRDVREDIVVPADFENYTPPGF